MCSITMEMNTNARNSNVFVAGAGTNVGVHGGRSVAAQVWPGRVPHGDVCRGPPKGAGTFLVVAVVVVVLIVVVVVVAVMLTVQVRQ